MSLSGKVIVITGASSGIGATVAKMVAAAGGSPVLVARSEDKLAAVTAECGENALAVVADCTKKADHQKVLDAAVARFGRVDVWINNAGVGMSRPALELTDEDIDNMMLVNCKSVLYGMQVSIAHFKTHQQGIGHVINVSSMLARAPFASVRAGYSASKAAMNSLTANVRVDLKNEGFDNLHVTLVTPGVVATDFGVNALHGGPDNKKMAGAQPVEEVAQVIIDTIITPVADVYTRPMYHGIITGYLSDIAAAESRPPFKTVTAVPAPAPAAVAAPSAETASATA